MKLVKKNIFPLTTLFASCYISFLFVSGVIIGCISTYFFDKYFIKKARIKTIKLNIYKWRIHFHHWLMGISVLSVIWLSGFLPVFPHVVLGVVGGVILHDFYFDKNWYRVILKK